MLWEDSKLGCAQQFPPGAPGLEAGREAPLIPAQNREKDVWDAAPTPPSPRSSHNSAWLSQTQPGLIFPKSTLGFGSGDGKAEPGAAFSQSLAEERGAVRLFSRDLTDYPINVSSGALGQIQGLSTTNLEKTQPGVWEGAKES